MKNTIKTAAVLIIILVLGFVIGFLVNGRLTQYRVNEMRNFNTPLGFNSHLMRMLSPDDAQMSAIKPILDEYARQNHELLLNFKADQQELMEDLREELDPLLTPEQLDQLNNFPHHRFYNNTPSNTTMPRHRNRPPGRGRNRNGGNGFGNN